MAEENEKSIWERTHLGDLLHFLGTSERFVTKNVATPLFQGFVPDIKERLPQEPYMGDVFRAAWDKNPEENSQWENLGWGALGFLGGAVADPITYVPGIGALTKAGKAASKGGTLALKMGEQASRGQRSLLQVGLPFSSARKSITPKVIDEAFFKSLDTLQTGKVAQKTVKATKLDKFPRIMRTAELMDNVVTQTANTFGVGIGMHPGIWQAVKKFNARLNGVESESARMPFRQLNDPYHAAPFANSVGRPTLRPFEDLKQDFIRELSEGYAIPPKRAAGFADQIITNTLAKDRRILTEEVLAQGVDPKTIPGFHRETKALVSAMGLPPSMSSAAELYDTPIVRQLREMRWYGREVARRQFVDQQMNHIKSLKLTGAPDVVYLTSILDDSVIPTLNKLRESHWQNLRKDSRPKKITRENTFWMPKMWRHIRQDTLDRLKVEGKLAPFKVSQNRRGSLNPEKILKDNMGKPLRKQTHKMLGYMLKTGKITHQDLYDLAPYMSPHEANALVQQVGIPQWGVKPGEVNAIFKTDPSEIMSIRQIGTDRGIASGDFFSELKAKGLVATKAMVDADPEKSGWTTVTHTPELRGFYMDPDSARWMNRQREVDHNLGEFMNKYMGGMIKAQSWWKGWTLAPFPAYHTRNYVGAMWNLFLNSSDPVSWVKDIEASHRIFKAIAEGAPSAPIKLGDRTYTAGELYSTMRKAGIMDQGGFLTRPGQEQLLGGFDLSAMKDAQRSYRHYGTGDPEQIVRKLAKRNLADKGMAKMGWIPTNKEMIKQEVERNWLGINSPVIDAGFKVAAGMDNRVRMAAFAQGLREGKGMDDALAWVRKTQYDYHDLSPVERHLFKNVLPFYAWSRKNIPAQLEGIMTHPGQIARFGSFAQSYSGSDHPDEEKLLADWMIANFPMRVKKGEDGKYRYLVLKNWLPLTDILDVFAPQEAAMEGLTPFAKVPLELMANYNMFTRRRIDYMNANLFKGEAGETTEMAGINVPNRAAHVIKGFRFANVLHDLIDNPQEIEPMEQILKHTISRWYPNDPRQAGFSLQRELNALRADLTRAMRSEVLRKGKEANTARLVERYAQKVQEIKKSRGLAQ